MTGDWKCVSRFDKNKSGRDFVCGDIHGCFYDLESQLWGLRFDKQCDRLFCVGDLIDRGPRSQSASDYMTSPWFHSVLGNHEYMFLMGQLEFPGHEDFMQDHIKNDGSWAYEMEAPQFNNMLDAIDKLPLIIQVEDVIIVHAALPPVRNLKEIEANCMEHLETCLWHREEYPPMQIPGIRRIFAGHTPVIEPCRCGQVMNIDTGAFRKYRGKEGKLTIMEIRLESPD